jgi:hypothetical protein
MKSVFDPSNLTILITGPIYTEKTDKTPVENVTYSLIEAILKEYPHIHIILSTWKQTPELSEYPTLKVVLPKDPGSQVKRSYSSNLNRQITSVSEGLRFVQTEYVLRIRSDFLFQDMSQVIEKLWTALENEDNKIVVLDSSRHVFARPYYVCDFLQFGKSTNVRKYWNCEFQGQSDFLYFENVAIDLSALSFASSAQLNVYAGNVRSNSFERYSPEEWLALSYIRSFKVVGMEHKMDFSFQTYIESFEPLEKSFVFIHQSKVRNIGRFFGSNHTDNWMRKRAALLYRRGNRLTKCLLLVFFLLAKRLQNLNTRSILNGAGK